MLQAATAHLEARLGASAQACTGHAHVEPAVLCTHEFKTHECLP